VIHSRLEAAAHRADLVRSDLLSLRDVPEGTHASPRLFISPLPVAKSPG
jgi:hypothetical protein